MHFGADPTFESFTTLCQHRIDVEKRELSDGFIEPDTPKPFKDGSTFGMLYSGGDKKSGRMFSSYVRLRGRELLTIYVEAIGIDPKDHVASFRDTLNKHSF